MTKSLPIDSSSAIAVVQKHAYALSQATTHYGPLLDLIGDAHIVLLGEASHGTHEFYQTRAEITKLLITQKGFNAVAVEADWPDAYRVNRYVRGMSDDVDGREALGNFQRFPVWMWRNQDVLAFVEWLQTYNSGKTHQQQTGFYGLDLYSLYTSVEAVINYLEKVDPEAAKRARDRYACFEQFIDDEQAYGYATGFQLSPSCEQGVISQLLDLQQHAADYTQRDGYRASDDFFFAEQNARLVKNAEEYYRTMFVGDASSWNLRDQHMTETLAALLVHLKGQNQMGKIVVWAHNSHLGDARATSFKKQKEINVGQLVRERYNKEVFSLGFSTYIGTVTAASDWGAEHERKHIRPALPESYEYLFHKTSIEPFLLPLHVKEEVRRILYGPQLERAIGVIYRPQTERASHYFSTHLPEQFDALIHYDRTEAVEPLDRTERWDNIEPPETYPSAL